MTEPDPSANPLHAAAAGLAAAALPASAPVRPEQLARLRLCPTAIRRALGAWARGERPPDAAPRSIAEIARAVGAPDLDRLLRESPRPTPCSLQHAATAHACAELARQSGLLSADEAYLLGLLHDPLRPLLPADDLPEPLRTRLARAAALPADDVVLAPLDCLLPAGELLASMAGFATGASPRDPHPSVQAFAFSTAAIGVDELRAAVVADLLEAGVEPELLASLGEVAAATDRDRGGAEAAVDPTTLALRLLRGGEGLLTGQRLADWCCRAAIAELQHDRATFVHWIGSGHHAVVRACASADQTSGRRVGIDLSPEDVAVLRRAAETGCTVRLAANGRDPGGLLGSLRTREALVAPVTRTGHSPAFVVVDRAASARPLPDPARDALLTVLAEASGMRLHNLLLERRSHRSAQSALVDPLTRLWNRRFGMATLDQAIARAQRAGTDLTVLMIDIDQFKKLNDTYGHVRGDLALRSTADVLRRTLRRSDTICRFGGEEFLVVLVETAPEEASLLAARLFIEIETRGHEVELPLTASIGQASLRAADTADSLLMRADRALYASKSLGRNRFSIDAEEA